MVGDRRADEEDLSLPHPRAAERAFVLVPWLDLEPEAEIPGAGPVAELVEKTGREGVEPPRGHRARVPADAESDQVIAARHRTRSRSPDPPPGHDPATGPGPLVVSGVIGLVGGWAVRPLSPAARLRRAGRLVRRRSAALFFVAAIIGGTAYVTRRTVRRNRSTWPTTRR